MVKLSNCLMRMRGPSLQLYMTEKYVRLTCCSMKALTCLDPALRPHVRPIALAAYLRFYSAQQAQTVPRVRTETCEEAERYQPEERYPRIKNQDKVLDYPTFRVRYGNLPRGQISYDDEVIVRGESVSNFQVNQAHSFKEEYGHFGLRAPSWHFSTCSKTACLSSQTTLNYNACLTIPK